MDKIVSLDAKKVVDELGVSRDIKNLKKDISTLDDVIQTELDTIDFNSKINNIEKNAISLELEYIQVQNKYLELEILHNNQDLLYQKALGVIFTDPNPLMILDSKTFKIDEVNASFSNLFNLTESQVKGKLTSELNIISLDDLLSLEKRLLNKDEISNFELKYISSTGEYKHGFLNVRLYESGGFYAVSLTDVDQLIENKNRLQDLNAKLEELNQDLMTIQSQMKQSYKDAVSLSITLLSKKSDETSEHCDRVGLFSYELASEYGFDEYHSNIIGDSARLHDIGKIEIPDEILKKPGKLDADEFNYIKRHTNKSENIFKDYKTFNLASIIALNHHEKWDGSGYPNGLKGTEIPIEARIAAVADVYDAITSKRVYKDAETHESALNEIFNESGKHFDPAVVECFIKSQTRFKEISNKFKEKKYD